MTLKFLLPVCAILVLAAWIGPVPTQSNHPKIAFRTVSVDGLTLFYREAGDPSKPAILLLHGFPSTSHMYGNLMTDLADRYHLIAPDYPGFGNSSLPAPDAFAYSFDHLATVMNDFIQALNLKKSPYTCRIMGGRSVSGWQANIPKTSAPSSSKTPMLTTKVSEKDLVRS